MPPALFLCRGTEVQGFALALQLRHRRKPTGAFGEVQIVRRLRRARGPRNGPNDRFGCAPCKGGAFQILCRRSGRKAASISVLIANHQCIGDTDGIPDSEQPAARWSA